MSEENITQDMIDKWNKQLEYCIENENKLHNWEQEHISSYFKYLSKNGKLSIRQSFVLNKIYNRL